MIKKALQWLKNSEFKTEDVSVDDLRKDHEPLSTLAANFTSINSEKSPIWIFRPDRLDHDPLRMFLATLIEEEQFPVKLSSKVLHGMNANVLLFIRQMADRFENLEKHDSLVSLSVSQFSQAISKILVQYMIIIQGVSGLSQDALQQIREMIKMVEHIMPVIEEVRRASDQAGLLALNASLEAAKTGHVGRGYAYVASEVQKLSQQSQNFGQVVQEEMNAISKTLQESNQILLDLTHADIDFALELKSRMDKQLGRLEAFNEWLWNRPQSQNLSKTDLEMEGLIENLRNTIICCFESLMLVVFKIRMIGDLPFLSSYFKAACEQIINDFVSLIKCQVYTTH
ncbi:MAG: methyl-accepting chemotaxis protein [Pseudomonadota bacterium]